MADKKKKKEVITATGRRKEAVARVRIILQGQGKIVVNGKDFENYFDTVDYRMQVKKPLIVTDLEKNINVFANVNGGGLGGQAGAVSLGIARCLLTMDPQLRSILKKDHLLTRDPRAKERKKYGRKGARRKFQWTKR
ncbi:MAG: 30S ribosomal protein S9 [Candidatus Omnitrophota bacterium]|nr:MAG: 30S ribosomal protein S9 [Candidatus Omnitrophota bacterium]